MKKLTTLLLAAGLVFAASAPASATDVKVDGLYNFSYQVGSQFNKGANNYSGAQQRFRLGLSLTASENLSGYIQFQDDFTWGAATHKHGDNGTTKMRLAYVDWMIPQTAVKVRMGRQAVGLPADAFGKSAIMDATWGTRDGVSLSAPVADWMNLSTFWVRVDGANGDLDQTPNSDAFGVVADLKFDGFSVSPYAMYASIDKAAFGTDSAFGWTSDKDEAIDQYDANAYWFGLSATMTYFDPFTLKLSGAYGARETQGSGTDGKLGEDRKGWYVAGKASYKTAYGTPVLGAWYGSGDDADDYGRQNWIPTMGGRFLTALAYSDGTAGLINRPGVLTNVSGTWGVQAGIEKVSFLDGLTHDFKVTLYKGTNNTGNAYAQSKDAWEYMTTSDTMVAVDLASTYSIYKNLSATLELSYMFADFDDRDANKYEDNAWRTGLIFQYKF